MNKKLINLKKIFFLFSKVDSKYKTNIFFQIILSVILTIMELFALGAILPALIILIKKDIFLGYITKYNLYWVTDKFDLNQVLYLLLAFIFIITLLRVFLSIFINYYKFNYFTKIQHELAKKLLTKYLNLNFAKFNNLNSGTLVNNIKLELERCCSYFTSILDLTIEIILITTILILILLTNFKISIFFIIFVGFLSYVFSFFLKSFSKKWGEERSLVYRTIYQSLFEIFKGFKNIKIYKAQKKFNNLFRKLDERIMKIDVNSKTLFVIPRLYFEGIIICAILILILIFLFNEYSENQIIVILSFYALCSYKIIPSISKIHYYTEQLNFLSTSFLNIYNEFIKNETDSKNFESDKKILIKKLDENLSIQLNGISFKYENEKIIENLNLDVILNQKIGILGQSGSGKSTLLDIITGLREPKAGEVFLNNDHFKNKEEYYNKIAYVDQFPYLLDDNLINNITLGTDKIDESMLKKALDCSLTSEFVKNINENLNKSFGEDGKELSGGQKQRIAIARALYRDPDILILDEPTSALDEYTEQKIIENIINFKKKLVVILVTHKENILKNFDKIYILEQKKLIEKK